MYFKRFSLSFLVLFSVLSPTVSVAQNSTADSLIRVISTLQNDTNKVKALCGLCSYYTNNGEPGKAHKYAEEALRLSEKISYNKGILVSLSKNGDAYLAQGYYPKSLESYFRMLERAESTGDKPNQSSALNTIGIIYWYEEDYDKALEYYLKSLEVTKITKNYIVMASLMNNIGIIYREKGNFEKALEYYLEAKKITEKTNRPITLASTLNNIGTIYQAQKDYKTALDYYFKSLKIREPLGDKVGIATSLGNIGQVYLEMNELSKAKDKLLASLAISKEIDDLEGIKEVSLGLSNLYVQKGDGITALTHYKEFIRARDTLESEASKKELYKQDLKHSFETEKITREKEQEKKDLQIAEDKKKHQIILFSISGGLIMMLLFSLFLFNRFRVTRQQKRIIEEQKQLVDQKNKDMMDSIHYAKRIQEALITSEIYIDRVLRKLNGG